MRVTVYITSYLLSGWLCVLHAQVPNDECLTATRLTTVLGTVCQDVGEGTNVGGSLSQNIAPPSCWPNATDLSDVWYSFQAAGSTITITLAGNVQGSPAGTLDGPELALYSGSCGNLTELVCGSDEFLTNSTEVTITDLTIGQIYYIRVAGRNGARGTFQLCLTSFNFVPPPEADCRTAVVLCDQSSFNVENLAGSGIEPNELAGLNACLPEESASTWYAWVCDDPGTLTFVLTPNNPTDDLDFVLFELPGGLDDCANKQVLRCMASGANVGAPPDEFRRCSGPTGLRLGETDVAEQAGCGNAADNNFLAPLDMTAGTAYALLINNFSQSGQGFSIDFGGTGTFSGPDVTIEITDGQTFDEIECDKEFTLQEQVDFAEGVIVSYEWRFGVDATPTSAVGVGPQTVTYSSIGEKVISLTLTTDEGCVFTETVPIDVLPCCDDLTMIDIILDSARNLLCFGDGSGQIAVSGVGGEPPYEFNINNDPWQFSNLFVGLPAGDYEVNLRDRKGCEDSLMLMLTQPDQITVDVGADQEIGLGCMTQITAIATPFGQAYTYNWTSSDSSFRDPVMASFNTIPLGTNSYFVTVTNEDGCTASDTVTIRTDDERPIFIPNAFSPNNDGINDKFTVYGGKAADELVSLSIYDRWGNRLFQGANIPINQTFFGWDGTRDGEILNPGVYAYVAEVRFLDGVIQTYHGDITLIK